MSMDASPCRLAKTSTCPCGAIKCKMVIEKTEKRAESDETVPEAKGRAEKFAQRYGEILEDLKKDPESHGGPPYCILLCRLREQVLREVGFRDVFKKVKDEENAKAISLFPNVINLNDAIEDSENRLETLVRGIFAGNIFDLGAAQLAEVFSKDGLSFLASRQNLVPRPWVIDDLEAFKLKWTNKSWKKASYICSNFAIIFVDNSGADIILGILPFARELLRRGTQVVLAANDLPSINDVTYTELVEIVSMLKDENGQLMGVDITNLFIVNSGNDLPVIDLSSVSQELAYLACDADLVIMEGNGRGIETNLYAQFNCDSINIGLMEDRGSEYYWRLDLGSERIKDLKLSNSNGNIVVKVEFRGSGGLYTYSCPLPQDADFDQRSDRWVSSNNGSFFEITLGKR
ncbi:hypothetical protein KSS87_005348 [Heliosperma pusillum]|nr:hypothetical protein KSS87_005348 [Heliosperma pusillum]